MPLYNFDGIDKNITLMVEIIYPGNKIIVDYGDEKKLILLSAFHVDTDTEASLDTVDEISFYTKIEQPIKFNYTIEEMIEIQKVLPMGEEGFVVRYSNGYRVKIKGHEYLRIARILSRCSPIAVWETMAGGRVSEAFLEEIPEEILPEIEPMVERLQEKHILTASEVVEEANKIKQALGEGFVQKDLGLFIQSKPEGYKHLGVMFKYLFTDKTGMGIDDYIKKQIRPDGNVL